MSNATKDELLALIDIMAKPLQEGGMGMADCADSPLMKLREAVAGLSSAAPSETIDDTFVAAVEDELGMGHGAWDMVRAENICKAVLKVAARAAAPQAAAPKECSCGSHKLAPLYHRPDCPAATATQKVTGGDKTEAENFFDARAPFHWNKADVLRIMNEWRAAAVPAPGRETWKILPDEQAWWWHWNGEDYAIPHICSVMVSKTGADRYFVADGGICPWCDELGGFWLKVGYPNVPARDEMKRLRADFWRNAQGGVDENHD